MILRTAPVAWGYLGRCGCQEQRNMAEVAKQLKKWIGIQAERKLQRILILE